MKPTPAMLAGAHQAAWQADENLSLVGHDRANPAHLGLVAAAHDVCTGVLAACGDVDDDLPHDDDHHAGELAARAACCMLFATIAHDATGPDRRVADACLAAMGAVHRLPSRPGGPDVRALRDHLAAHALTCLADS